MLIWARCEMCKLMRNCLYDTLRVRDGRVLCEQCSDEEEGE